jgi:hypothetical protein
VLGRSALLLFAFLASVATAQAASRWATLEAIHHLENPNNLTRPGPHGELGAYQIRLTTWRMHTTMPFSRALDRRFSDLIAVEHYEYLKRELEAARIPATPYNIALAWNGGLNGALSGKAPRAAHDYAQRAANLAAALDRPQLVASIR